MPVKNVKFLLVDDLEGNLLALAALLEQDGLELLSAKSGPEALELLLVHEVALVFLDVQMPGMSGFELAELMRGTARTRHIPIIFVTAGATDHQRRFRGYELGAVDFLFKPIDPQILQAKADVFFELARQRNELQLAAEKHARLAREIKVSEERYRAVVETQSEMICRFNAEGIIRFVNPAFTKWCSKDQGPAIGQRLWDFFPETDIQTAEEALQSLIAELPETRFEARFKSGVGMRWILWTVRAIEFDASGRWTDAQATGVDISERKAAENALRESEERFRLMANAAPVLIWLSGPDKSWSWFNQAWLTFAGRTLPQDIGTGWCENVHPEDREHCLKSHLAALEGRQPFTAEYRLKRHDGEYRWLLVTAVPRQDSDGQFNGFIGSCIDVTDRKNNAAKLEQAVTERTHELRQANEQLEAFAYSIAHDLRAPLRAIYGYSQLLNKEHSAALNNEALYLLSRIQGSSEFMDRLLLDLLAFGRVSQTAMSLKKIPIEAAWDSALLQCASQIEQTKAWIETIRPLPSVLAHEATLSQCFANLLGNALKFMTPGVTPTIRFWTTEQGDTVRIWIADNGIGIPSDQQERIFRVFERMNGEQYPGTGIGLAIVRKGVERMGGQMGLESQPNQGSRFWIELAKGV
ncbi:MAG TPA: PAS domain S-box protein [Verrucomicrobiae bacterium]